VCVQSYPYRAKIIPLSKPRGRADRESRTTGIDESGWKLES
jgi:hypothetical protein